MILYYNKKKIHFTPDDNITAIYLHDIQHHFCNHDKCVK